IVIGSNKEEIDRIALPVNMSPKELETRLTDILEGRNTLQSMIDAFWKDTTSIVMREQLINMFEERSKYDSVLYHLEGLANQKSFPTVARGAGLRYAYLRLQVEGNTEPLEEYMTTLGSDPTDSALHYELLDRLREHFEKIKKADSTNAIIEEMMAFTGFRDPDFLNDLAWNIASYGKNYDSAARLINEAIGKKADDPDYYDTRALVNGRLHKMADAIRDEETAVSYASGDNQTYFAEQLKYYKQLKEEMEKKEAEKNSATKKSD
ncbi:MAG TPA: hypothetical protein VGM92_08495, partial [Candidatus Kapabacteria bacterium]